MSHIISLADYSLTPRLPDVFDATMMSDWHKCPAYFYLRHVLGLKKRDAIESNDLNWGSMWHRLLHAYHTGGAASLPEVMADWPAGLDETESFNRTAERMFLCFRKYMERYDEADRDAYENLRHEQYFDIYCASDDSACPYGGCGLRWCGRMDRLVREIRKGRLLPWDYKTTRRMDAEYPNRYKHSFQMPGYFWAASHLTGERPYAIKLDTLYTITKSEDLFRWDLRYTDGQILEWRDNVKRSQEVIQETFARYAEDPEAWTKNWSQCMTYGRCVYGDIHFTPPTGDNRLQIMQGYYIEDRWDPAEVD